MELSVAITKYPNGMLFYWDKQSWVYYKRVLSEDELSEMEPEELEALEVAEGEDWSGEIGYAPDSVCELAKVLGIKVDSI